VLSIPNKRGALGEDDWAAGLLSSGLHGRYGVDVGVDAVLGPIASGAAGTGWV
jgi:hypothetical protein